MRRILTGILIFQFVAASCLGAIPRLNSLVVPERGAALLLIVALFGFGIRWRTR